MDCVEAARYNTTVFDDLIFQMGELKKRLIVTNIMGTAHA